jgi:multicomponent Na+:H+ antiporter subunit F
MIYVALLILFLAIALMVVGVITGETSLSKMVSVNCITSYIIGFIALLTLIENDNKYFLDVAVVYSVLGFISSLAFLKYLIHKK